MLPFEVCLSEAPDKTTASRMISGDDAILARRYAGAFYELAEEQKQLDSVAADLRLMRVVVNQSPEFKAIASQPRLTRAQRIGAMKALAVSAKFNPLTMNFLSLVAQNSRLKVVGAMIESFLANLAAKRGEFTADICAAQPLSAAQEEKLALTLRDMAGGKVHLSITTDPALLGGMTIKFGSKLIDASVRAKLQRLGRQLHSPLDTMQQGVA